MAKRIECDALQPATEQGADVASMNVNMNELFIVTSNIN